MRDADRRHRRRGRLLAPYGARLPYQLMLAPRRPRPRFEDDGPLGARCCTTCWAACARRLGATPPLNMWVRTAPRGAEHFCWRIDVLPRLAHLAGLELGAGVNLNVVAPESRGRAPPRRVTLVVAAIAVAVAAGVWPSGGWARAQAASRARADRAALHRAPVRHVLHARAARGDGGRRRGHRARLRRARRSSALLAWLARHARARASRARRSAR